MPPEILAAPATDAPIVAEERAPRWWQRFSAMTPDKQIDSAAKVLGLCALIIGGIWTYYGYFEQRDRELDLKQMELNGAFWKVRSDACFEVVNAAVDLALSHGERPADQRFQELFWGKSSIIETPHVAGANPSLEMALAKYADRAEDCRTSGRDDCWEKLLPCTLDIANQCRQMICGYLYDNRSVDICKVSRKLECP